MALEICLLGPLQVMVDGAELRLTSARQRAILARLALEPRTVVSSDRIVDEVWGDRSGAAALHTQMSRLRAALGVPVIATVEPGYRLDLDPGHIDVHRFRALVQDATVPGLAEALSLWRGTPLADLDAPFVAALQRDLEDLRRDAIEAHGDALVRLGRHDEAIPDLRALVAEDPFRERAWAALITALHRCGRRADALDAYGEVRRTMATELGLEPGPALRELQAEVLAAPGPAPAAQAPRGSRRTPWLATGAALLAAAGAGVALFAGGGSAPRRGASVTVGGHVLRLDAATGAERARYAVGAAPGALTVGAGATWVLDADAQTITELGPASHTFATGAPPLDVAATADTLFVGTGAPAPGTQIAGPVVAAIQQIAPATRTVRSTAHLAHSDAVVRPPDQQLALVGSAVWSLTGDGSVVRLGGDPVPGLTATGLAAGPAGLWAIGDDGAVARIDPDSARVMARTRLPASSLAAAAVGTDAVWVTAPDDGTVWRIPAGDVAGARAIRVTRGVRAIAIGHGGVWAANPLRGTLTRIDERTGQVTRTLATGGQPRDVTVAGNDVWASVAPGPVAAADVQGTIAGAPCEPPQGRVGVRPDVLLASDLPLQGGVRVSTQHMTEAIAADVRARGFHAGRFSIAYVSCDDSIARTGIFDPVRCATNARAYIREPRVLGVIGALNSPCTQAALGELPADGPVYVSPLSTDPALTRQRHPFVRVIGQDGAQAAALVAVARRLGARRVFVADDGDPAYGAMLADGFRRAAASGGVRIVGAGSWDPAHPAGIGQAAARVGADTVVLAGLIDDGGIAVLRDVKRSLPRAQLLLTDGFTPTVFLRKRAGAAAEGAYVATPSATLDALTPAGRAVARRLSRLAPDAALDIGAFYAAQAADVLLDAIARSDGTRAGVLRAVRATNLAQGLLGPVRFDAAGDIEATPVTILRIDHRAPDDARVDQVVSAPGH